ncbi:MAG: AAA family ATPase [Homoserinimonas sp.]
MSKAPPPTMLEEALGYASRGFYVLPLKPGRKDPMTAHGWHDATTDAEQLATWWGQRPAANIGLATGPSGVAVVDVDVKDGKQGLASFDELTRGVDLDSAVIARTASGGRHYYVRDQHNTIPETSGRVGVGLDTKGATGYVVAPPSVVDGKPYTWESKPPPSPASLPRHRKLTKRILERTARQTAASAPSDAFEGPGKLAPITYVLAVLSGAVGDVAEAPRGQRNEARNKAAYKVGQYLHVKDPEGRLIIDEADAVSRLLEACSINGSLEDEGGRKITESIAASMAAGRRNPAPVTVGPKPGTASAHDAAVAAEVAKIQVREEAQRVAREAKGRARPTIAEGLLTIDELADRPGLEWAIKGLLFRNTLALLVGPSGLGKSFLALAWALCIASGRDWLGRKVRKGRALYVAAEGDDGLHKRVLAWLHGWIGKIPADGFVVYPHAVNLADDSEVDDLAAVVAERKIDLIVIDTLNRSMGGLEENSATSMSVIIASLDRLREANPGACVLVVHHTGHDGDRARGSSALHAAMHSVLVVSGDSSNFKLEATKDKDGPGGPLERLMLAPVKPAKSMVVTRKLGYGWADETEELAPKLEEALAHITRAFSATGATKTDLRDLLVDSGFKRPTAYRAINALLSNKRLTLKGSRFTVTTSPDSPTN